MSAKFYRKCLAILCLLCLLGAFVDTRAFAVEANNAAVAPQGIQAHILQNGMKILLREDHSFPVVSCLVWYRVGSRNDNAGLTGLAHLVEHLLFQNVGNFRKGELGATIVRNGGQFNGFTSDDFTAFFETLHASKLDLALRIEADRMRRASFTPQNLKEEVSRINTDIDQEAQDQQSQLMREVRAAAFLHHPYRNPPIGWKTDLENITLPDARAFYDRYYHPDNATIVLVGDFKSQSALAAIAKYFGAFPKGPARAASRVNEPPQHSERRISMHYAGKKDIVEVAYHAPALNDPDAPSLVIIEKMLNASYSGKLRKFAETKTIYSGRSTFELKKDPSLFTINFDIAPGNFNKLMEAWDAMVAGLKAQPIADADLRRAKNQAEYAYVTEQDGPYRYGFNLGFCDALLNYQAAESWTNKLKTVSAADVQRVAKKYFNTENRVVAVLTAPQAAPKPNQPASDKPGSKPPTKPTPAADSVQPTKSRFEHVPLTGYKQNDSTNPGTSKVLREGEQAALSVSDCESAVLSKPTRIVQNTIDETDPGLMSRSGNAAPAGTTLPTASTTSSTPATESGNGSAAVISAPAGGSMPANTSLPAGKLPLRSGTTSGDSQAPASDNQVAPSVTTVQPTTSLPATSLPGTSLPGTSLPGTSQPSTSLPNSIPSIPKLETPTKPAVSKFTGSEFSTPVMQRRTLKNGISLIVMEDHLASIVQVVGVVKAGRAFEPASKIGVADLLAAVLNNGTFKATKSQMQLTQEDLGLPPSAMIHFDANIETLNFKFRCLSRDLPNMLRYFSSCVTDPAIGDGDIDHAKAEVLAQYKNQDDSSALRTESSLLRTLLAAESPYYPEDLSNKATAVGNLKAADLNDFRTQNVVPEGTTIVMVGDVSADVAAKLLDQSLTAWTRKAATGKNYPVPAPNARKILKTSIPLKDKSKTFVCMGRLLNAAPESSNYAQLMLADCAMTNHPIFSRLAQRFGSDPALSENLSPDAIESRFTPLGESVAWSINLPVAPQVVSNATNMVQSELRKFGHSGVTPEEFSEVRRFLLNALAVRQLSNDSDAAKAILDYSVQSNGKSLFNEQIAKLRASNVDTLNKFIHAEFKPEQATLVVAGTRETLKSIHGSSAATDAKINGSSASPK